MLRSQRDWHTLNTGTGAEQQAIGDGDRDKVVFTFSCHFFHSIPWFPESSVCLECHLHKLLSHVYNMHRDKDKCCISYLFILWCLWVSIQLRRVFA